MKKYYGFTLAEALIAIGIIGIVATLTIPNMINKYKAVRNANLLRKIHAELTQALRIVGEDNDIYTMGNDWSNTQEIVQAIAPYMKTSKTFPSKQWSDSTISAMCYTPGRKRPHKKTDNYYWINGICTVGGPIKGNTSSIELPSGACIGFNKTNSPKQKRIIIDINGPYNPPNTAGQDWFVFEINQNGQVIPLGVTNLTTNTIQTNCNKNNNTCGGGQYCSAKIINDGWRIKYY